VQRAIGGVTEDRALAIALIAFNAAFLTGGRAWYAGSHDSAQFRVLIGLGFSQLAHRSVADRQYGPVRLWRLGNRSRGLASSRPVFLDHLFWVRWSGGSCRCLMIVPLWGVRASPAGKAEELAGHSRHRRVGPVPAIL